MKQERLEITIFMLLLSAVISLHGQVTIGAGKEPLDGAILDLKQKDAADGGVTSTLGIILPRVKLINLQPTAATGANSLPVSIGAAASENWDLSAHTGLTVYNVDVCSRPMIQKGAYTWTGTEWKYLGQEETNSLSPDVHEFIDPRDGEKYLYRTFGTAGEWMLENLRYIPDAADGYPDYTELAPDFIHHPWMKYYTFVIPDGSPSYDPSTAKTVWESGYKHYGIRYSYGAAINIGDGSGITVTFPTDDEGGSSTQPVRRGVCPPDWHVPSDYEWAQLTEAIKINTPAYANETGNVPDTRIGVAMKNQCEPFTNGVENKGSSKLGVKGGFDALLAGKASTYGLLTGLRAHAYMASSSTANSSSSAWGLYLSGSVGGVIHDRFDAYDHNSVRCKKDAP